ncbi:hypothetical protein SHIRM173S_10372 [Streptomyces hirsutus]
MTATRDGASYEVAVRAESALGEGPTWDPATGRLLWIDILNSRLNGYDPATGRRTLRRTDQHVGAVKPRVGGGLVLNLRDGIGLLDPDDTFRGCATSPSPAAAATRPPSPPTAPCGPAPCATTRPPAAARSRASPATAPPNSSSTT